MNQTDQVILDRFEGNDQAVLELNAGITLDLPRSWLPPRAKEGDVLRLRVTESESGHSSLVQFVIDAAKTAERREEIKELRSTLPKAPEGNLEL